MSYQQGAVVKSLEGEPITPRKTAQMGGGGGGGAKQRRKKTKCWFG